MRRSNHLEQVFVVAFMLALVLPSTAGGADLKEILNLPFKKVEIYGSVDVHEELSCFRGRGGPKDAQAVIKLLTGGDWSYDPSIKPVGGLSSALFWHLRLCGENEIEINCVAERVLRVDTASGEKLWFRRDLTRSPRLVSDLILEWMADGSQRVKKVTDFPVDRWDFSNFKK
jgi:hypothetical protein